MRTTQDYKLLFNRYYTKCMDVLSPLENAHNAEYELYPFLYSVTVFASRVGNIPSDILYKEILPYIESLHQTSDKPTFQKHALFYLSFFDGRKPLGLWSLSALSDEILKDSLSCCIIAFGDVLVNPACIDNYELSPVTIDSFSQMLSFNEQFVNIFVPMLIEYLSLVADIKPHSKAVIRPQSKKYTAEEKRIVWGGAAFILSLLIATIVLCNTSSVVTLPTPTVSYSLPPIQTPTAISIFNGEEYVIPDFERLCPLTIIAEENANTYVYLEYLRAPTYSTVDRMLLNSASAPYQSDIAFIVCKNCTVEVDIPIGVYKLYCASGENFYGTDNLFGEKTTYTASDDLLEFFASQQYYEGHSITLYTVYNGNFDTKTISANEFPSS